MAMPACSSWTATCNASLDGWAGQGVLKGETWELAVEWSYLRDEWNDIADQDRRHGLIETGLGLCRSRAEAVPGLSKISIGSTERHRGHPRSSSRVRRPGTCPDWPKTCLTRTASWQPQSLKWAFRIKPDLVVTATSEPCAWRPTGIPAKATTRQQERSGASSPNEASSCAQTSLQRFLLEDLLGFDTRLVAFLIRRPGPDVGPDTISWVQAFRGLSLEGVPAFALGGGAGNAVTLSRRLREAACWRTVAEVVRHCASRLAAGGELRAQGADPVLSISPAWSRSASRRRSACAAMVQARELGGEQLVVGCGRLSAESGLPGGEQVGAVRSWRTWSKTKASSRRLECGVRGSGAVHRRGRHRGWDRRSSGRAHRRGGPEYLGRGGCDRGPHIFLGRAPAWAEIMVATKLGLGIWVDPAVRRPIIRVVTPVAERRPGRSRLNVWCPARIRNGRPEQPA